MSSDCDEIDRELYFLIAKFLDSGPCKEAASVLKAQLSSTGALPYRRDWHGTDHKQTYEEVDQANPHIAQNFLKLLCAQIGPLIDNYTSPDVRGIRSLLCNGRQSLLRTGREALTNVTTARESCCYHSQPALRPLNAKQSNLVPVYVARTLHGSSSTRPILRSCNFHSNLSMHKRILGHLASVYCVLYDRTGSIIATGADDHLVKLWSSEDGRLVSTLRGHTGEIADLAISFDNTVLASGSCDKTIRVWNLQSSACIAVLQGHSGMITSLEFSPLVLPEISYLMSTGADGTVCFWKRTIKDNIVDPVPLKFIEKSRPGAQMLCSSFSPGGAFLVTGSSDNIIRIYQLLPGPPERIAELSGHNDHVDSIQYNHGGDRFVSGSRDGTAKVWHYQRGEWKMMTLSAYSTLQSSPVTDPESMKSVKLKVTMVGWSLLDDLVVTAITDHTLKVWNSRKETLVHVMKGHTDEVYCLECHPTDPHLFLSAGHDGNVILWDMQKGSVLTMFFNMLEGQGHGALFDCRFSPDGMQLTTTDSHGHLCLYGYGPNERFKKVPYEQFFHTDYRPLIRDANNYVLDEQTQLAPHLMPPPFLVDVDGNPHSIDYQLLIPGRNERNLPQRRVRQSLDELPPLLAEIEAAERGTDRGLSSPRPSGQREGSPLQSPGGGGVGLRQTGDIEGVRQLQSNAYIIQHVSSTDCAQWRSRQIAPFLTTNDAKQREAVRLHQGKDELQKYLVEKKRRPLASCKTGQSSIAPKAKRTLRERRKPARQQPPPPTRTRSSYSIRSHATPQESEEDVDVELLSSDVDDDWASDSSSESSECSDWTEEAGVRDEREAKRRRVRRVVTSEEEEGGSRTDEPNQPREVSSPSKRKEDRPKKAKKPKQVKCPSMKNKEEFILHFQPPDWMMMTKPKKSPYFPQIGDEVYYYRQGHQLYVQEVIVSNAYHCSANKQCYERYQFEAEELCRVLGCHFGVGPPRVCSVKLGVISKSTGVTTGKTFTVKYHDMPDVLDFLVLRQHVEQAERCAWKTDDRFRCVIDDCWWSGVITDQSPFQDEFPESKLQTFSVRWDTGEEERMSPWDLEKTSPDDDAVARTLDSASLALNSSNIPLTEEDQRLQLYTPEPGDWGDEEPAVAVERISAGLSQFVSLGLCSAFLHPVDPAEYPDYYAVVAYPIDLTHIQTRLTENFYRRKASLLWELRLIEKNTKLYNEAGSDIERNSSLVVKLLSQLIQDVNCNDVTVLTEQINELGAESDLSVGENEGDEEKEATGKGARRSKRRMRSQESDEGNGIGGSSSHTSSRTWPVSALQLINFLISREDSAPFRNPVDVEAYPEYPSFVEEPMDFSTIKHRLENNQYVSPECVLRDIRLVFSNSRSYNTNKRSRIYVMTIRLSALFESRAEEFTREWLQSKQSRPTRKNKRNASSRRMSDYPSRSTRSTAASNHQDDEDDCRAERSDSAVSNGSGLKLTLRRHLASQFNTPSDDEDTALASYRIQNGEGSGAGRSSETIYRHPSRQKRYRENGMSRIGHDDRASYDTDSDEPTKKSSKGKGKRQMNYTDDVEQTANKRTLRSRVTKPTSFRMSSELTDDDDDEEVNGDSSGNDGDSVPPRKRNRRSSSEHSEVFEEKEVTSKRPLRNASRFALQSVEDEDEDTSSAVGHREDATKGSAVPMRYSTRLRNGISCAKSFPSDEQVGIAAKQPSAIQRRTSRRQSSSSISPTDASTQSYSQRNSIVTAKAIAQHSHRTRSRSENVTASDQSEDDALADDDAAGNECISVSSRGRVRRSAQRFADYVDM